MEKIRRYAQADDRPDDASEIRKDQDEEHSTYAVSPYAAHGAEIIGDRLEVLHTRFPEERFDQRTKPTDGDYRMNGGKRRGQKRGENRERMR